jgi:hypothetical protein
MRSAQIERERLELSAGYTSGIDDTMLFSQRNCLDRPQCHEPDLTAAGVDGCILGGDAEEGYIELTVGDNTNTRTLTRQNSMSSQAVSRIWWKSSLVRCIKIIGEEIDCLNRDKVRFVKVTQ